MDFSKIQGLLETNDSIEIDDNDLEEELNAILSGKVSAKPVNTKPQTITTTSSSSRNVVKTNKPKDSQTNYNKLPNKRPNTHRNEIDLLNIEKLDLMGDLDDDNDDEDIDEDNEDLLAEINDIASDPSSAKRVHNRSAPNIPPIDYMSESQSFHTNETNTKPTLIDNTSTQMVSHFREKSPKHDLIDKTSITPKSPQLMKQTESESEKTELNNLRDQYKRAALNAKKCGDQSMALSHIKTAKQIEVLIKALEDGQSVDLSQLPPPPPSLPKVVPTEVKSSPQTTSQVTVPQISDEIEIPNIELNREEAEKLFNAPPPPTTAMEALEQRLAKFKSTLEQAKEEENDGKVRRLGRIVKQYENVIKDVKKGKQVDFEELPTPPGFGPIPTQNANNSNEKKAENQPINTTSNQTSQAVKPIPKPQLQTKAAANSQTNTNKSPQTEVQKEAIPPKAAQRPNLKRASSTANKQLNYLLERQQLFKEAALVSKQKGDIQQAKEYLRMAKGFDPLIEATQNGLPIDATSIPTPPQMSEDFVVVSLPENNSNVDDLEREEIYRKIEIELQNQIEMCKRNKEYFLQLGDVSTASKFEKYAVESRKDMDMLITRWRNGDKFPSFKYETRNFSIVMCNTEVGTNEISLEVLKALDIPGKSDIDTYIKVEFPFPNDRPQTGRTKTVKNSINPVFNETFKFDIDRKSRQLPRVFKRHPLKLELISKGGFLRSDLLIGTALIKMTDFENKCTIHESFPLTEGKKTVGGKIEARVRIREPLLSKQIEEVKEKWLIFI